MKEEVEIKVESIKIELDKLNESLQKKLNRIKDDLIRLNKKHENNIQYVLKKPIVLLL